VFYRFEKRNNRSENVLGPTGEHKNGKVGLALLGRFPSSAFTNISEVFRVLDPSKHFGPIFEVGQLMGNFPMDNPIHTEILYKNFAD